MDKQQIENTLRDYAWMINEIKRQRGMLEEIGENVVAQSGIESAMPKAQGNTSDPVAMEVIRRDKKRKWVEKLEKKVLYIQQRIPVIKEEREKAVLECMLDGMSMSAISQHMGLSRRHIYTIKNDVVDKIAQTSHFAHNAHFAQQMTNEKRCV